MRRICRVWVCGALLVVCGASAWGQGEPAAYKPPEDIAFRKATIISEGTRMAAELFSLKPRTGQGAADHHHVSRLGRRAEQLRPDAVVFARAGYLVVAFDYRGWGASEARVVLIKPARRGQAQGAVSPPKSWKSAKSSIRWIRRPICSTPFTGCTARRSATRNGYWTLGIELRRRPCRLCRRPRPARQGHRQPGARHGFAFCRADTGGPEANLRVRRPSVPAARSAIRRRRESRRQPHRRIRSASG